MKNQLRITSHLIKLWENLGSFCLAPNPLDPIMTHPITPPFPCRDWYLPSMAIRVRGWQIQGASSRMHQPISLVACHFIKLQDSPKIEPAEKESKSHVRNDKKKQSLGPSSPRCGFVNKSTPGTFRFRSWSPLFKERVIFHPPKFKVYLSISFRGKWVWHKKNLIYLGFLTESLI